MCVWMYGAALHPVLMLRFEIVFGRHSVSKNQHGQQKSVSCIRLGLVRMSAQLLHLALFGGKNISSAVMQLTLTSPTKWYRH